MRFDHKELDVVLADFLGKPWKRNATGPDAYDCYTMTKAFLGRLGVEIADIGKVDPHDMRPVYERQQTDYIQLTVPRPWSVVTFSGRDLNAHIGVILPDDGLFLHCPGRAAGEVIAEPLSRRPWRDSVDGYWWPKGWIETVVMLTPMTATKRCWQFVRSGRCLAEIVEQDIVEGRNVPVQVFLGGELVPEDRWADTVPTEMDQIVVRPIMGEGRQAAMMAGMLALAVFAPAAAGAILGGTPSATAAAVATGSPGALAAVGSTSMLAYNLTTAGVMMVGGIALNALVGPEEAKREGSQHNTWNPQTTARPDSLIPLVYGTYGVRGTLLCAYASSELTTETSLFIKDDFVRHATDVYYTKIGLSDGPIQGIVSGTERLNDRDPQQYADTAGFILEHFNGTDDQAASTVLDAFEVPVNLACNTNVEVTKTFTAVDCDSASLVLRFPNGFTDYEKDGGHKPTHVDLTIRARISGGSWSNLFVGQLGGDSRDPVRIKVPFDGVIGDIGCATATSTYTVFPLTNGTTYEIGVKRTDNTHSDRGDDFLFDSIQFGYATAQTHPGLAYTAIGAAASKDISGSIQYYVEIQGKLVCIYDADGDVSSIEWSDNPAWVAADLLTRPVIAGNGTTIPYYVEYYRRLNPSYLLMADFITFAAWCDEMVDDGESGTEKRYRFNGVFDQDGTAWTQAIRACRVGCATPYFNGHRVGITVDKPGIPTQMFNVSNLRSGFSETWIDTSEAATMIDCEFANEQGQYVPESYPIPLAGAERDVPVSGDYFGHTKRSQVWRRATRDLRVNHYMKRTVEIPACLDAIYTTLGDIVYVQHPSIQRATGGRILEVYADGVKLDKPVTMNVATDYALLIRTHDGTSERLSLYEVSSVTGTDSDIVTISGVWDYTPNPNDLWTFGEEVKVIDLYRVKSFERSGLGRVLIHASQYTTDYYVDDENPAKIQAQVYSETKGGIAPSLLPTTEQAIAANRPDGNSTIDTLTWEGLAFTGNAVNTVTWTCESTGGMGIKYKGTPCPIIDDAVGTTKRWIYFDPAIGDPRYLQATDDINDLIGYERYVFCENVDGIAYRKPALLVTTAESKLEDIEAGADVTVDHAADIISRSDTEPASPTEGCIWYDTSANPVVVKRYDGSQWVVSGVDLRGWLHPGDNTMLDGSQIFPSSITADALGANVVVATKILAESLSAITAVLGDVIGGSITGATILAAVIKTGLSGRRVHIDSDGIKMLMSGGNGLCGTTANGGSNIIAGTTANGGSNTICGSGVLARIGHPSTGVPVEIVSEQATLADLHLVPRSADPSTGRPGDIALVSNKLRVCTAVTPTWQDL